MVRLLALMLVMLRPEPINVAAVTLPPVTMSPDDTPKTLRDVPLGVILFAILIKFKSILNLYKNKGFIIQFLSES